MNTLVVLFAVLGAVAAKPSILANLGGSSYHRSSQFIEQPDAVSSQYREEVTGPKLVAAPVAYSAYSAWAPQVAHYGYAHHGPATILTPHGVPLDTPEVFAARAAHFQAKALASHGLHYLKKRSLYEPLAYSAVHSYPTGISHQSRVDVHSSPVLTNTVVAEPILAKTLIAEPVVYTAPSAVSHQSRIDVHSSPVLANTIIAEPVLAKTVVAEPIVYTAPSAISHQSRFDVHSRAALFGGYNSWNSAYNGLPHAYGHLAYAAPHNVW